MFFKNLQNKRLLLYLILVIAFYVTIICFYKSFHITGWEGGYMRKIADAMLFALPILLCRKKSVIFPYLLVANLYILSIVWYYRTYDTVMPLSSYLMINNLDGLGPSIWHSIRAIDIVLIIPLFVFSLFYSWAYDRMVVKDGDGRGRRWMIVGSVLIISGIVFITHWPDKRPFYKQPFYLFSLEGVNAFKRYGFINYWLYQLSFSRTVSNGDKQYAESFVNKLSVSSQFAYSDSLAFAHKNLIVILVESLQSWPIGLTIDRVEVTPNIDSLLNQTDVVYFPKVMSQVKDGRSSDAQLLINTGLLPLTTGAASSLCSSNKFPSIADALRKKHYYSASFICDCRSFWNQGATTIAYGFDDLYDCMQGNNKRGEADENLFEKSLPILQQMKQPFYTQLVTLSSHEPYVEPIVKDSPLIHVDIGDDEVRNYLIAIQYVDKCIAGFLEGLKKNNLYDNSIIVITGDHEQMTFNRYQNREQLEAEDCFVPLIIINSPLSSKNTDKAIGQMDIYPSLLNLMGCYDYSFKGLGESVFKDSVSNYVTYRTGLAAGDVGVLDSVKKYREECWKVSDILLRMNYFE